MSTEEQNKLSETRLLSDGEIKMLMEGCRRSIRRIEHIIWTESERAARLELENELRNI